MLSQSADETGRPVGGSWRWPGEKRPADRPWMNSAGTNDSWSANERRGRERRRWFKRQDTKQRPIAVGGGEDARDEAVVVVVSSRSRSRKPGERKRRETAQSACRLGRKRRARPALRKREKRKRRNNGKKKEMNETGKCDDDKETEGVGESSAASWTGPEAEAEAEECEVESDGGRRHELGAAGGRLLFSLRLFIQPRPYDS